jgi:hypothetical protein
MKDVIVASGCVDSDFVDESERVLDGSCMVGRESEIFLREVVDHGVELDNCCVNVVGDEAFWGCAYAETTGEGVLVRLRLEGWLGTEYGHDKGALFTVGTGI